MINRALARSIVFQELFSYYHSDCQNIKEAEEALGENLTSTHDLYYFLIAIVPALTDTYRELVERNKKRFYQREEDSNPNTRLLDNELVAKIENSDTLSSVLREHGLNWHNNDSLLKNLLSEILASPTYVAYAAEAEVGLPEDVQFWVEVLQKVTFKNPILDDYLSDCSIYWSNPSSVVEKVEIEDLPGIDELDEMMDELRKSDSYQAVRLANSAVEIQKDFTLKTLRKAKRVKTFDTALMPMFKDEEDEQFTYQLLRSTIIHGEEYRRLIDEVLKNWESERLADSDLLLLQQGIAELLTFPGIKAPVTINEYIELAKIYSTGKSASFINGLLDAILQLLRERYNLDK